MLPRVIASGSRTFLALFVLLLPGILACERDPDAYGRTVDPGLREEYYWAVVGEGVCGSGRGTLVPGASPPDEGCDAARSGGVAVCWDADRLGSPGAPEAPGCMLVDATRSECREGSGGGRIWECVRTDAE